MESVDNLDEQTALAAFLSNYPDAIFKGAQKTAGATIQSSSTKLGPRPYGKKMVQE